MLIENKTECNQVLNGFIDRSGVILSTKRLKCLDYHGSEDDKKEFDLNNFSLKKFQIIDIKGFKRFLRLKDVKIFKDISGSNTKDLSFNGLTFIKDEEKGVLYICDEGFNYGENIKVGDFSYNIIIKLSLEWIKPIFRELKNIDSLEIFLNYDLPVYFQINTADGFLIAPRVTKE